MRDGEEGETPDKAIEIMVDADPIRYALVSADDLNWYKFEAEAGKIYVIETFNSLPSTGDHETSMDPYIYLYNSDILTDPDTTEIDDDDDSGSTGDWEARIEWTPTESGMYYIILRHYDSEYDITGEYDISVVQIDD